MTTEEKEIVNELIDKYDRMKDNYESIIKAQREMLKIKDAEIEYYRKKLKDVVQLMKGES